MKIITGAATAALLTLAASAGNAQAPEPWAHLFRGGEATAYIDTSRIVVRDGVADVWLRVDYDTPDVLPDSSGTFQRIDMHERVECAAERVSDRGMVMRDAAGKQVGDANAPPAPRAFAAHPLGEYIFPILCKRLPEWTR